MVAEDDVSQVRHKSQYGYCYLCLWGLFAAQKQAYASRNKNGQYKSQGDASAVNTHISAEKCGDVCHGCGYQSRRLCAPLPNEWLKQTCSPPSLRKPPPI